MIKAKQVVRFLGGPAKNDVFGIHSRGRRSITVEFVNPVIPGLVRLLPDRPAGTAINTKKMLNSLSMVSAGGKKFFTPQYR
jgi:hypothetical protein